MMRAAVEIRIGLGSCGVASGGEPVRAGAKGVGRLTPATAREALAPLAEAERA